MITNEFCVVHWFFPSDQENSLRYHSSQGKIKEDHDRHFII